MAKFTFVSFNIKHQTNLFESILKYVTKKAKSDYIIFAIQEMPRKETVEKISIPKNIQMYRRGDLAFVYSKKINGIQNNLGIPSDDVTSLRKNVMLLTIPLESGSLQIVNIHAMSKLQEVSNIKKNRILFQNLEKILGQNPQRVYMGDFNTNPYEENLVSEDVLCTSRELDDVCDGRTKAAFYNPGWRYLKEKRGIKGTFCDRDFFPRWQILDHIIVSKDSCKTIHSFSILKEFSDMKINLNEFQKRSKPDGYSDHLPVSLTMEV